jgi:hypothetical protein
VSLLCVLTSGVADANRFAVIGDSGSRQPVQRKVAGQLVKKHRQKRIEHLLMLGDLAYPDGHESLLDASIKRPYQRLWADGVIGLPALGDHDVQVNDGSAMLNLFGMGRARYYQTTLAGGLVDLFVLDTTVLVPQRSHEAHDMLRWFSRALQKSNAPFKITASHHPLYSSYRGRFLEVASMRRALGAILRENRPVLHLAGHHHHYERSHPIDGTIHVISGGAGRTHTEEATYTPKTRAAISMQNHFLTFDVTPQQLRMDAISVDDVLIDSLEVPALQRSDRRKAAGE